MSDAPKRNRRGPDKQAKDEFQYIRHGTVCVTANWHVVRGQLLATTITETRDNEDFARHIQHTIATDPNAGWVFVVDNLNTHCGAPLVRMVAQHLGIDPESLGKAKRHGILKTMSSRRPTGKPLTERPRTWRELRRNKKQRRQLDLVGNYL
ncbi:MAG: transposase [Planctomycetota bacterium]